MYQLARKCRGERITASWIPIRKDETEGLTPRARESLKHYHEALPAYLQRNNIDSKAILEMRTEVYVADNHRMYVRAYALNDRGKEHVQFVWA